MLSELTSVNFKSSCGPIYINLTGLVHKRLLIIFRSKNLFKRKFKKFSHSLQIFYKVMYRYTSELSEIIKTANFSHTMTLSK